MRTAVIAAAVLLRRSLGTVIVTVLTVQGVLVWGAMPVLATLMRTVLTAAGIDGINQTSVIAILSEPIALLALIGFAIVAVLFIVLELAVFSIIAHLRFDGVTPSFGTIARGLARTGRKLLSWQAIVLAAYVVVLLPLSNVGVTSVLTTHIAIPAFVSGELTKTTAGTIIYWAALAVIAYAALRFVLTMAHLTGAGAAAGEGTAAGKGPRTGADTTILGAMRHSFSRTWRLQGWLAVVIVGTGVAATMVVAVAAAIGLVPVLVGPGAGAGAAGATGATLAVLDIVRFLATGIGAAFLSFVFVAVDRISDGEPVAIVRTPSTGRGAHVAVAVIVTAAVLLAVPRVIESADAAPAPGAAASTAVIAHRGYTAGGVENSLEALQAAAAAGADRVELDIQETSDGGFVVIHDVSLARLAGDPRSVYDLTEAQASAITIRQDGFTSHIPTFTEFVAEADRLDMPLLVEVKPHGHERSGFAARVVEEMNRLDPAHRDIVQSLDRGLIEEIAAIDPLRPTAFVVGLQLGDLPESAAGAVVIEDWSYSDSMLSVAHQAGRGLYVWTVDDPQLIGDYLARGVDGIITDEVASAVTQRRLQNAITNPVSIYLKQVSRLIRVG